MPRFYLVVGFTIAARWSSGVAGSSVMLSTCSHLVAGKTWIIQSRRRSSGKYQAVCLLRPVLLKNIKDNSCFSHTMVGVREESLSFWICRQVISAGAFMVVDFFCIKAHK